jgi:hypothetical protein
MSCVPSSDTHCTCVLFPTMHVTECERPGFQPFAGKSTLYFWIRPNSGSTDTFDSSTPEGQVRATEPGAGMGMTGCT